MSQVKANPIRVQVGGSLDNTLTHYTWKPDRNAVKALALGQPMYHVEDGIRGWNQRRVNPVTLTQRVALFVENHDFNAAAANINSQGLDCFVH